MFAIKTEEERARLDELFAQVEAELNGESYDKPKSQVEIAAENSKAKEKRIREQGLDQLAGCVRQMRKDNVLKTRWERIMADVLLELYDNRRNNNTELNVLRNFANAVDEALERAEKAAKEQDNHHYYKLFATKVKNLLEKL